MVDLETARSNVKEIYENYENSEIYGMIHTMLASEVGESIYFLCQLKLVFI
jgi:hypothetical protein